MEIPNDSAMLASFLNMKLRDEYESLSSLCDDLELSEEEIVEKLAAAGFHYSKTNNRFS